MYRGFEGYNIYIYIYIDFPKGPCIQIVYTLALEYLYRGYIKAKVHTIWAHGPLGLWCWGGYVGAWGLRAGTAGLQSMRLTFSMDTEVEIRPKPSI